MKTIFVVFLACSYTSAQFNGRRSEFEVASIKPSLASDRPGEIGGPGTHDPHHYRQNWPLAIYVKVAYLFDSPGQYVGLPWMDTQFFVVNAKVPDGATKQQLREMLQVLLEQRFKLKFHYQKKEVPAYRLVVAKGGPKLKTAAPESIDPNWVPTMPAVDSREAWLALDKLDRDGFPILPDKRGFKMVLVNGGARIRAYGQPMGKLAGMLTGQVGRRVLDGTGLTGHYDFTLAFSNWASAGMPPAARGDGTTGDENNPAVSIFGAIQKQLGLRLEPAKTMIDVFVVDSAEKVPINN
jgi:uncharacterized protein (TIGR03435 family)